MNTYIFAQEIDIQLIKRVNSQLATNNIPELKRLLFIAIEEDNKSYIALYSFLLWKALNAKH